jgi:hypothetical protein
VNNSAPTHFKQSDMPLLCLYCTAVALSRYYAGAIGEDPYANKFWVENARLATSIATKLRLTPSTRYDARQADRNSNVMPEDATRPWEDRT